jgi:hypothetical protein
VDDAFVRALMAEKAGVPCPGPGWALGYAFASGQAAIEAVAAVNFRARPSLRGGVGDAAADIVHAIALVERSAGGRDVEAMDFAAATLRQAPAEQVTLTEGLLAPLRATLRFTVRPIGTFDLGKGQSKTDLYALDLTMLA